MKFTIYDLRFTSVLLFFLLPACVRAGNYPSSPFMGGVQMQADAAGVRSAIGVPSLSAYTTAIGDLQQATNHVLIANVTGLSTVIANLQAGTNLPTWVVTNNQTSGLTFGGGLAVNGDLYNNGTNIGQMVFQMTLDLGTVGIALFNLDQATNNIIAGNITSGILNSNRLQTRLLNFAGTGGATNFSTIISLLGYTPEKTNRLDQFIADLDAATNNIIEAKHAMSAASVTNGVILTNATLRFAGDWQQKTNAVGSILISNITFGVGFDFATNGEFSALAVLLGERRAWRYTDNGGEDLELKNLEDVRANFAFTKNPGDFVFITLDGTTGVDHRSIKTQGVDDDGNPVWLEIHPAGNLALTPTGGTTTNNGDIIITGSFVAGAGRFIGSLEVDGSVQADSFSGDGTGLTISASNLTEGTVPNARLTLAIANLATNAPPTNSATIISKLGYTPEKTNRLDQPIADLQAATNHILQANITGLSTVITDIQNATNHILQASVTGLVTALTDIQNGTNALNGFVASLNSQGHTNLLINGTNPPVARTVDLIAGSGVTIICTNLGSTNHVYITATASGSGLSGSTNFTSLPVQSAFYYSTNQPTLNTGFDQWELLVPRTNSLGTTLAQGATWSISFPPDYSTNSFKVRVFYTYLATNGPNTSNLVLQAAVKRLDSVTDSRTNTFGAFVANTNTVALSNTGTNVVTSMLIDLGTNSLCGPGEAGILKIERNTTNDTFGGGIAIVGIRTEYVRP